MNIQKHRNGFNLSLSQLETLSLLRSLSEILEQNMKNGVATQFSTPMIEYSLDKKSGKSGAFPSVLRIAVTRQGD